MFLIFKQWMGYIGLTLLTMYLMKNTSCPIPWDKEAMFKEHAEPVLLKVKHDGEYKFG